MFVVFSKQIAASIWQLQKEVGLRFFILSKNSKVYASNLQEDSTQYGKMSA